VLFTGLEKSWEIKLNPKMFGKVMKMMLNVYVHLHRLFKRINIYIHIYFSCQKGNVFKNNEKSARVNNNNNNHHI